MTISPLGHGGRAASCALLAVVILGGGCRSSDTKVATQGEVGSARGPSVAALVAEGDQAHARGDDATAAERWQRALLVDRALAGQLGVPARLADLASRSGTLASPPNLDAGSIGSLFNDGGTGRGP